MVYITSHKVISVSKSNLFLSCKYNKMCHRLCSYEFVKYLRHYVESSLGTVVEDETESLIRGDGQNAIGSRLDASTHGVTQKTRDSAE